MSLQTLRARFAPSPTGYLHIGGARTALFNWALARRLGGRFILRIEDTDVARNIEDAEAKLMEDLRWLGIEWDEGPDLGGPHGPYRQSQRLEAYRAAADRLLDSGHAYFAFDAPEELDVMRRTAAAAKRAFKYPRPSRFPSRQDADRARAEGRPVVVRCAVPSEEIVVHDEILGNVAFPPGEVEDFVIVKSNGWPTYHFAVVVDDAHMRITHVLRAQEHLMNTPKHVALQRALGVSTPAYAHLPLVMNLDGSKMSKRDKQKDIDAGRLPREIDVHDFRVSGYLPEAIVNFIALLGWSPGDGREKLSMADIAAAFSVDRIIKTSARFDRDKLLAFNTDACAAASAERLRTAFRDYARLNRSPLAGLEDAMLDRVLTVCRGFRTFRDVDVKVGMLFRPDDEVVLEPDAVKKVLARNGGHGVEQLRRILSTLRALPDWTHDRIETAIKSFCDEHGLKMADVAQPLRVAMTGRTISPAIGETLALLSRDAVLRRIERCIRLASSPPSG